MKFFFMEWDQFFCQNDMNWKMSAGYYVVMLRRNQDRLFLRPAKDSCLNVPSHHLKN